jgi:acyl carrier protein
VSRRGWPLQLIPRLERYRKGMGVEEQIKQVMADILDLIPDSIDESTTRENIITWDSLAQINLLVALEQEFNVSFKPEEIESMLSFSEILEILDQKVGAQHS